MSLLQSILLCKMVGKFSKTMERVDDDVFHTYPHFVGNCILLYGKKNSYFPFHCMVGPHWPVTAFTVLFITIPTYYYLTRIPLIMEHYLLVYCTGTILLSSFLFTACTDPGIVFVSSNKKSDAPDLESQQSASEIAFDKLNNIKRNNWITCGKCNIDRPPNAFHCYDCNVCMEDLDHHCVVRAVLCYAMLC
jgi:hypothetical protein